jgi:hypothetical protein
VIRYRDSQGDASSKGAVGVTIVPRSCAQSHASGEFVIDSVDKVKPQSEGDKVRVSPAVTPILTLSLVFCVTRCLTPTSTLFPPSFVTRRFQRVLIELSGVKERQNRF